MNRTKHFFYNTISTGFYQAIIMIAGFITPRIMLKYYGSEINGLVTSINQFIVYFNLVEAGLSSAATYALYKPLAEKNYKAINAIVSAAKKFYTQAGYIFISLTVTLALFYPLYLKTDSLAPYNIAILVLVLGVNGALEFFTLAKYRVLLSAAQKIHVISLASSINIIINTAIVVVFGRMQINIVFLKAIALLSIFSRTIILLIYTRIKYKYLSYKEKPDYNALKKRWDALYLQILGAIHVGAPVIILTIITNNLKMVSLYTVFNMIIGAINGILSIFISGLSASFGDVIAKKETEILKKAYSEFEFAYYALISIVYSTAFVTIMPFINIYTKGVTDINYNQSIIGILFVLNGLLYNVKTPQGMLVISAGLFKETRIQTTIQGGIMVFLGSILAYFFGIHGVLLASIISNCYRVIDLLIYVPKNLTKLPIRNTIYRVLRIIISVFVVCFPFTIIKIAPPGYFSWALNSITIVVYSSLAVICINFVFEREMMKNLFNRVMGLIN